jgi:predicted AlkP superfamily phosphohydrolase/phosphomutase
MGSGETILNPNDNFKNLRNSLSYYKDYLDKYMSEYEGEDKEEKIEKIRQDIEAIKKEMNKYVEYDKDYEFGTFTSK